VDQDVSEAHHAAHDGRQIFREPPATGQEVEEFPVRAWFAQALVGDDVGGDVKGRLAPWSSATSLGPPTEPQAGARLRQGQRATLPRAPDHVPELCRPLEKEVLQILVTDCLDGGDRASVPGHHDHVPLRRLDGSREIVAHLEQGHGLHGPSLDLSIEVAAVAVFLEEGEEVLLNQQVDRRRAAGKGGQAAGGGGWEDRPVV
jgi:hypothetical protein